MYNLKIIPILISYNFYNSKKYILSVDEKKINFPLIDCENIKNIKAFIIEYLCGCFIDSLTIKPYINNIKFIDINNNITESLYNTNDTIYTIFGTTVPKLDLNKHFWTSFDFVDTEYAYELSLIGKTIQYNV